MKHQEVFERHIRDTELEAIVSSLTVLVTHVTREVMRGIGTEAQKTYISTRVLKHLYDKRRGQECDCIIRNLEQLLAAPQRVYRNKGEKRGSFCFLKELGGFDYFCVIEECTDPDGGECFEVVTAYRLPEEANKKTRYLASYELLWSWRGDESSS